MLALLAWMLESVEPVRRSTRKTIDAGPIFTASLSERETVPAIFSPRT